GQICRVQHRPFRPAFVAGRLPVQRTIVDALATQRSALFAQVDADLMGAPRLEPAFDQREIAERLDNAAVRDRALSGSRAAATASPVAAIGDEIRFDA